MIFDLSNNNNAFVKWCCLNTLNLFWNWFQNGWNQLNFLKLFFIYFLYISLFILYVGNKHCKVFGKKKQKNKKQLIIDLNSLCWNKQLNWYSISLFFLSITSYFLVKEPLLSIVFQSISKKKIFYIYFFKYNLLIIASFKAVIIFFRKHLFFCILLNQKSIEDSEWFSITVKIFNIACFYFVFVIDLYLNILYKNVRCLW